MASWPRAEPTATDISVSTSIEIGFNFFFLGKARGQTVAALVSALVTREGVSKSSYRLTSLSVNLSIRLPYPRDEHHPLIE